MAKGHRISGGPFSGVFSFGLRYTSQCGAGGVAERLAQHLRRAGLLSLPKAGRDESLDLGVKIWGFPSGLLGLLTVLEPDLGLLAEE